MLLNKTIGAAVAKKKDGKKELTDKDKDKLKVYKNLGKDRKNLLGVFYKIFANNNRAKRDQFFTNSIVRAFWPTVLPLITYELCFGKTGVKGEDVPSFKAIIPIIQE